ncbi:MAG: hypothetical protein ACTSVY_13875 [Candidatus Helarchaeota archaeon]
MLFGLAVLRWDVKYGMKSEAVYPESLEISDQLLKQIYTNHEFEEEAGFLALTIQELNLASYYTGPETEYYVVAVLSIDENPEDYEDILSDTVRLILANTKGRKYKADLPQYYKQISDYPKMVEEQRLALILLDPIKKMIIDRLIEDGNATKSELSAWLKDRFGSEYIDIDSIINSLLRNKILREETLEKMTTSSIFLIGDIFVSRIPPKASIVMVKAMSSLDEKMVKNYLNDVQTFFENYSPNPEDQEEILKIIIDMDAYQLISRLRKAPISQKSKIYEKIYNEIKNFNDLMKWLWEAQIITVLKNKKGEEYIFLKSDIGIKYVFPEYLIDKIRQLYYDGSKADNILIEHLRILQDRYYDFKKNR